MMFLLVAVQSPGSLAPMKKLIVVLVIAACGLSLTAFGQAEKIKAKAKEVKRNVESGQTNKAPVTTNAPAKK